MSAATKLLLTLLFLFLTGLIWAAFYDTIFTNLPAANPYVIANDGGTWNTILWNWGVVAVIIAIGAALNLLGEGNINSGIQVNAGVLCMELILVVLWISLWVPMNVTIPAAFGATPQIANYDNVFLFFMFGLDIVALIASGTVRILSGGNRRPKREVNYNRHTYKTYGVPIKRGRPRGKQNQEIQVERYGGYERYQ
jgi:hypothetical protein